MQNQIGRMLTQLGLITSHPAAFGVVCTYGVVWAFFDHETFGWHGYAVMATWLMTLVIERAGHRDTQAIHAKLDELLHAERLASNELTQIDSEEPEAIEQHRNRARRED